MTATVELPTAPTSTPEQRRQTMDAMITGWVSGGWRLESRSDFQAVLVKGRRPNHLLHLLLSIFTLGLWLLVWPVVAIFAGEKRRIVGVDEYGTRYGM